MLSGYFAFTASGAVQGLLLSNLLCYNAVCGEDLSQALVTTHLPSSENIH